MTFVATANAVEQVGATPVLVDCEPGTGLIDLDAAEAAITPRTRAIMPGAPRRAARSTSTALGALRDAHGLTVIEDAAHAIGPSGAAGRSARTATSPPSRSTRRRTSRRPRAARCATDNPCIARRGRAARAPRAQPRRLAALLGRRLPPLRGRRARHQVQHDRPARPSIGLHQLPRLEAWIERARRARRALRRAARRPPAATRRAGRPARMRHARHLYPCCVDAERRLDRDAVLDGLPSAHRHRRALPRRPPAPVLPQTYGIEPGDLPVATDISERTLSLPLSPKITDADQDDVVEALEQRPRERSGARVVSAPRPPTGTARRSTPVSPRRRSRASAGRRSSASGRRSSRSRRWSS